LRLFRLTERREARRIAERLAAQHDAPVRVVPCGDRGLRLIVGEDERTVDIPVTRERRRRSGE
jgi:hypothetical protein